MDIEPSDLIPDADSETVDGDPVDIVEALKHKREAAEKLLPLLKPMIEKAKATSDGDEYEKFATYEEAFRQIAKHFDIDYDAL